MAERSARRPPEVRREDDAEQLAAHDDDERRDACDDGDLMQICEWHAKGYGSANSETA